MVKTRYALAKQGKSTKGSAHQRSVRPLAPQHDETSSLYTAKSGWRSTQKGRETCGTPMKRRAKASEPPHRSDIETNLSDTKEKVNLHGPRLRRSKMLIGE